MKTVLLLVHADAGQEARLQAALALVRALDGGLHCADVVAFPTLFQDPTGMAAGLILTRECQAAADNRRRLEARLTREGVSWTWRDMAGPVSDCLTREAILADLIVINTKRDDWRSTDPRGVASVLALKARAPVLAVPDAPRAFDPHGVAVVAWDGSPPAMAALRSATPLLALAAQVQILSVLPGADTPASGVVPAAAQRYLQRYDIEAKCVSWIDARPQDGLLAACAAASAAYCVMGAYGHGRLAEDLLGGVTRGMLDRSPIPLILHH